MCSMVRLSGTGPASFSAVACGRVLPARRCKTFSLIRCVMRTREPRLCAARPSGKVSRTTNTGTLRATTPHLLRIDLLVCLKCSCRTSGALKYYGRAMGAPGLQRFFGKARVVKLADTASYLLHGWFRHVRPQGQRQNLAAGAFGDG